MRTTISMLLVVTIASVNGGYLHGSHISPATNVVQSRTIVGSAIGGGPTGGAISSAQYSQTVSVPANVQTVISTHSIPTVLNYGYPGTSSNNNNQNTNGHNGVGYGSYGYNNNGHDSNSAAGGQNPGYAHSSQYNQRNY